MSSFYNLIPIYSKYISLSFQTKEDYTKKTSPFRTEERYTSKHILIYKFLTSIYIKYFKQLHFIINSQAFNIKYTQNSECIVNLCYIPFGTSSKVFNHFTAVSYQASISKERIHPDTKL